MEIVLDSSRCMCLHSKVQIVDIVLQSILLERQFIPDLVGRLLESNEKFAADYNKITDILRDCFRSRNRALIKEVVIVVGPTCYQPRELFRIPIRLCCEDPEESGCGCHCGELMDNEVRSFKRMMMTRFPVDVFKKLKRTDRAYLMINAHESLQLSSFEEISEEDSFDVSGQSKALQTTITMNHECQLDELKSICDESSRWFRMIPHLKVVC